MTLAPSAQHLKRVKGTKQKGLQESSKDDTEPPEEVPDDWIAPASAGATEAVWSGMEPGTAAQDTHITVVGR